MDARFETPTHENPAFFAHSMTRGALTGSLLSKNFCHPTYPPSSESVNHPFFDQLRQVDISSVVHFVHGRCRFLEAFEHILGRYVKRAADDRAIVACLLAWGTNLGLGRMGDVS